MVAKRPPCHPDGREATGGPAFLTLCLIRCIFAAAVVALAACGGGDTPTAPTFTIAPQGSIPPTVAGSTAGDSIRVKVFDGTGAPKAGISVSFAVTAGGGSVSPSAVLTDALGRAAAKFTTGPLVGVNTATATIARAAPVVFSVTTVAGPAATIALSPRITFIDAGQRATPTVTAADANGNQVTASQLVFAARTPSIVSIGEDGAITGIGLGSTIVVASSATVADSILIVVTSPGGPVLQSDLTRFDVAHDTTFTVPIVLDMRTPAEKLGATTITVRWDPALLTFVSQVEGSSAAGATVNATGVSQGVLTLAVASVNGMAGRIELRRITFKATSTVGRTGTLRLNASELSAAGTFADLLPKTTSVTYPLSVR